DPRVARERQEVHQTPAACSRDREPGPCLLEKRPPSAKDLLFLCSSSSGPFPSDRSCPIGGPIERDMSNELKHCSRFLHPEQAGAGRWVCVTILRCAWERGRPRYWWRMEEVAGRGSRILFGEA